MMKRRILSILAVLFLLFMTAAPCLSVKAETPPRLIDMADLLSESEESALLAELDEISNRQKFDVVVVTTNDTEGKTIEAYADDFYDNNGFGQGSERDGILLAIDMSEREYHMSTRGYGIVAFTDYGMEAMDGYFVKKLSSGNYYDAFDTFAKLCDDYVTQAKNGAPYDTNTMNEEDPPAEERKRSMPSGGAAGIAGLIGLIVGSGRSSRMKSQLKTVRRQSSAANYAREGSMHLKVSRDDFLYRNVTRTEKPKDTRSSSGGGSTTHHSSSGATHGGHGGKF